MTSVARSNSRSLRRCSPVPGTSFASLQFGPHAADLKQLSRRARPIDDLSPDLTDFADTAAAITALDLVITVDTSVAHLAGALGKPVWVLTPWVTHWRWMLVREDSPWYPTMRLFRQQKGEDRGPTSSRAWPRSFKRSPKATTRR